MLVPFRRERTTRHDPGTSSDLRRQWLRDSVTTVGLLANAGGFLLVPLYLAVGTFVGLQAPIRLTRANAVWAGSWSGGLASGCGSFAWQSQAARAISTH
jgi:hypothetical protein